MNYRIKRGDQEFGPYSLAELKQYIVEGRIIPTDLARSEGMEDWAKVADVTGDMELPFEEKSIPPARQLLDFSNFTSPSLPDAPPPPRFHWAFVLGLTVLTFGIFAVLWMFVQANWIRKIDPGNKALGLFTLYVLTVLLVRDGGSLSGIMDVGEPRSLAAQLNLAGIIFMFVGHFKIRAAIANRFGGPPWNFRLSRTWTFLLNVFYIQHYFTKINRLYAQRLR